MATDSQFSNKELTELLRSVAAAYLLRNENRFKIIAYEKAADTIEHLNRELKDIWQEGNISKVPTIGPSIRESLEEYFKTGKSKHFDSILGGVPKPVFSLMRVPSIGPKKAFKLVEALHLENSKDIFKDLLQAAKDNKIAPIPTFGEKSQTDILDALTRYGNSKDQAYRMPLPYADQLAQEILSYMKQLPTVLKADALGSLRRMSATIGDIDIAVAIKGDNIKEVIEHFLKFPKKLAVDNAGEKKASIILPPNIRVDLRVQDIDNYGSMLQYFTGNKAHNIRLRELALKKGYSLSEWGIKTVKTGKTLKFKEEPDFYKFLGFQYVPPEMREGRNELAIAAKHELPKLVEVKDIKGDLHTHSSYDLQPSHDAGANTYFEMAREAYKRGYEYIGFTDHNPKISGLTKSQVVAIMKKRKQDIDKVFSINKNERSNYFISLETDILPSGELALPEEAIEYVDYLLVSVHSSFKMNIDDMTKRVLKALSYPKVKVLGHPTGRLLGKREGFELHWKEIFEFVKKKNIAMEINSWPERLDLPDSLVYDGIEEGVKFVIDTDSHAVEHMKNMPYGVSVARRGWAKKTDIINTLKYEEFKKWISS
jgi:DNA polymerase (family 10)